MLFCVKVSKVNLFPYVPCLTEKIERKGNCKSFDRPSNVQVDRRETRIGGGLHAFFIFQVSFLFFLAIDHIKTFAVGKEIAVIWLNSKNPITN